MPHLTVHASEPDLAGREEQLMTALTDAVVEIYGEWARPLAVIHLHGVPPGRWAVGGKPHPNPSPTVTFGIKEAAFARPEVIARLATAVTDAVATVLGRHHRPTTTVDFVGTLPGRTAVGGTITD